VPFGRYYLLGLIARGGMAEVYRARAQVGSRRLLAIKVMRPQLAREPGSSTCSIAKASSR